jgi:hypothetical protein
VTEFSKRCLAGCRLLSLILFAPGSQLRRMSAEAFSFCLSTQANLPSPSVTTLTQNWLLQSSIEHLTFEGDHSCTICIAVRGSILGAGCSRGCKSLSRVAFESRSQLRQIKEKVFVNVYLSNHSTSPLPQRSFTAVHSRTRYSQSRKGTRCSAFLVAACWGFAHSVLWR